LKHIGIKQVPLVLGLDRGALAGPCDQQALGGQHLDGLAQDRPAGAILLAQVGLVRESDAIELACDDRPAQILRDGRSKITPFAHCP
jgi:hypothetical protein